MEGELPILARRRIEAEIIRPVHEELVREVGARLPSELHLGADRLVISATHTHGGPAHYFASPNYAGAFSGETTGFDPRVLDFLATRIAGAIARAAETAQPARIAWTHAFVNGGRDREPAIGQNRSVVAHCGNEDPMGELGTTCRTIAQSEDC